MIVAASRDETGNDDAALALAEGQAVLAAMKAAGGLREWSAARNPDA